MSAATITFKRRDPAVIAARAHAVLHASLRMTWPEGRAARKAIGGAALDLDAALDDYRSLADGSVHWEQAYPHLSAEADPHEQALVKAAEETCFAMASLLVAIAAICGTEVADVMKNAAGVTA